MSLFFIAYHYQIYINSLKLQFNSRRAIHLIYDHENVSQQLISFAVSAGAVYQKSAPRRQRKVQRRTANEGPTFSIIMIRLPNLSRFEAVHMSLYAKYSWGCVKYCNTVSKSVYWLFFLEFCLALNTSFNHYDNYTYLWSRFDLFFMWGREHGDAFQYGQVVLRFS